MIAEAAVMTIIKVVKIVIIEIVEIEVPVIPIPIVLAVLELVAETIAVTAVAVLEFRNLARFDNLVNGIYFVNVQVAVKHKRQFVHKSAVDGLFAIYAHTSV